MVAQVVMVDSVDISELSKFDNNIVTAMSMYAGSKPKKRKIFFL